MTARNLIAGLCAAALAGCISAPASAPPVQDISFVGGCWEQHDGGSADFLRLLRDRRNPGGFVGDQTRIRAGEQTYQGRWTFAPDGVNAELHHTVGLGDEYTLLTPSPDLAAEDRVIPPGASAAFFWNRPGQTYVRVLRQDDMLRISGIAARGRAERYKGAESVWFEGRLSGCD